MLIKSNPNNDAANFWTQNIALFLTHINQPKNTKKTYKRLQKKVEG